MPHFFRNCSLFTTSNNNNNSSSSIEALGPLTPSHSPLSLYLATMFMIFPAL